MKKRIWFLSAAALLCGLVVAGFVWANSTPDINWWVIGGGGGHAEAGIYALDATIGQPVAGKAADTGYELCSGFWCGMVEAAPPLTPTATPTATPTGTLTPTATPTATPTGTVTPPAHLIYLPIILKNYP